MKSLSLAVVLALFGGASAEEKESKVSAAVQWVCPLYEYDPISPTESWWFCEECDGVFDLYLLSSSTQVGDCADSAKVNCFMAGGNQAAFSIESRGLSSYYDRVPKSDKKVTFVGSVVAQIGKRKFRLMSFSLPNNSEARIGLEVHPT